MQTNQSVPEGMSGAQTDLAGVALELAYVKSCGLSHLKCTSGSFAMFDTVSKQLTIFGEELEVVGGSFHESLAADVLQDAQSLGAAFDIQDGRCSCRIGTFELVGESYVEAALRALITYRSHASSNEAPCSEINEIPCPSR